MSDSDEAMLTQVLEIEANSVPIISSPQRTLLFFIKFTLQETTRLILSYDHHDHDADDDDETVDIPHDDVPPLESSTVFLNPDDKSSWESIRSELRNLVGLETRRSQNPVLRVLATYINDIIKDHFCPSNRAQTGPKGVGLRVDISVAIDRVTVHRDRLPGPPVGPEPADEAVIGSLKRVRAEDYLGGTLGLKEIEKCLVCLEELTKENEVTCLPCEHVFHEHCIVKWLKTSHYCPLCRFELPVCKKARFLC